ncbi:fibronectin type III domain-containing protein [candidate division KSB1 bacterium]|nr:fibronectin type III domain-containing protein [candidate division KSB1 bacterium]
MGKYAIFFFCFVFVSVTHSLFGSPEWNKLRLTEPVIIPSDSTAGLIGTAVDQIFAFSYSTATQSWQPIPFQIDEKGIETAINFYDSTRIDTFFNYFGELNGILDTQEELLFMAQDAGDRAPENQWITDTDSKNYPRIEIQIFDPLNPEEPGYFYLYKSITLKSPSKDYVQLTPATTDTTGDDFIQAVSYSEGHDKNGFTTDWSIPLEQQGNGLDFMDFLKMRLKVDFGFMIGLSEVQALQFRKFAYTDGPIRVVRRLSFFLVFSLFPQPIGVADFTTYYYPYHTQVEGPTRRLSASWGVAYLRQSIDLNENAIGMQFYNPMNSQIIIDGKPDATVVNTLLDSPAMNWHLITGTPGSVIFTYTVPALGERRELYYFDNDAASSGDGFETDSGDGKSYGDIGIAIFGQRMEGSFGMSYDALFLGANQDPSIGTEVASLKQNPLTHSTTSITYDWTPPAAIMDLQVTAATPNSITLTWTAPGDDGATGKKVTSYDLRYQEYYVRDNNFEEWWEFAYPVSPEPMASLPGEQQSFKVTGLSIAQEYYFVILSQDDMGNWSDYSNQAFGTALPVELSTFSITQQKMQVLLKWMTTTETNNHGFDIERQRITEPVTENWQVIGFVAGHGTSLTPQAYQFADPDRNFGKFGYRLKQIDRDGRFEYSEILTINIRGPEHFALGQNYPNPFNPETKIEFQIPQEDNSGQSIILRIVNMLGEEVTRFEFSDPTPGFYDVVWDGTNYQGIKVASGIYFYQLITNKILFTRKMTFIP